MAVARITIGQPECSTINVNELWTSGVTPGLVCLGLTPLRLSQQSTANVLWLLGPFSRDARDPPTFFIPLVGFILLFFFLFF